MAFGVQGLAVGGWLEVVGGPAKGSYSSFMKNALDLPAGLPVPADDGACDHLQGMRMPELWLASTSGEPINLAQLPGRTVLYCYPRTGQLDQPIPEDWDAIPGARGCTPKVADSGITFTT